MFKAILVPLSGSDTDKAILDTAWAVARPSGSHIECYHHYTGDGEAMAYMPHASHLVGSALHEAMEWLNKRGNIRAAATLRHFGDFCQAHAIPTHAEIPYAGVSASILQGRGDSGEQLCFHARHHDLVVMGRPKDGDGLPANLVQKILLAGGHPLLLVPEHATPKPLETIVLAWKETAESAHAITAALPLLMQAKQVILLCVDEGQGIEQASIQANIRHLAWHGVQAQSRTIVAGGRPTVEVLWSYAHDCHADLLVMGAYSRGPTRELLFGGCTDSAMIWGELPVFFAH